MRQTRSLTIRALFAAGVLAVAGCGGSDDEAQTGGASTAEQTPAADGANAKYQERLQAGYQGTFSMPPTTGPKPPSGKTVWIIPCAQAASACANSAAAQKEAAEALGWEAKIFDGKYDPNVQLQGIRAAVTAKADAITGYAIDCQTVRSGLKEAREAGVEFVAIEAYDCSDVKEGDESLFSHNVHYSGQPYPEWIESYGQAQADWVIAKTDGKAKVIDFAETDNQALLAIDRGFRKGIETCAECEIVERVTFVGSDLGPKLQQKAEQALLKNPDANATTAQYDAVMTSGVLGAIRGSGRSEKLAVMGGEGAEPNIKIIKENGGQDAGLGLPPEWEGYAAIDALVHIFAGEEPNKDTGMGYQLFDKDHNLPESGGFVPLDGIDGEPIDYRVAYRQAWGVGG